MCNSPFWLKSIEFLAVLPGSLRLLATLDAGALVVLATAHFGQNTGLGAAALEALQGAVQRLIFSNADFRHLISLPPKCPGSYVTTGHEQPNS